MSAENPDDAAGLADVLTQTAFVIMARISRIAAAQDLSLTQLRVVAILADRRLRMSDLAAYLGLDKSTMSGLVDRAAARGLLERGRSTTDGRAVEVFLTAAGQRLAADIADQVAIDLEPMTRRLGTADQRRVAGLLTRLLG